MKARAFLMTAAVLLAPWTARGQTASEGEPGSTPAASSGATSGWRLYPREKHLLLRAVAGTAVRLNDPFGLGRLAPPTLTVDAAFTVVHLGQFQFGPYLGLQIGFDRGAAQTQFAVVPGAVIQRRFSSLFALNARVGLPLAIVRGNCPSFALDASSRQGMGATVNRAFVQVPDPSYCPTVSVGVEAAVGAALYLRAGFAVTAEIAFDLYVGDGGIPYPLLGGGIGLLFDYEVIP